MQEDKLKSFLDTVASQSSGSTLRDLKALSADAGVNAISRIMKTMTKTKYESGNYEFVDDGEEKDGSDVSSQLESVILDGNIVLNSTISFSLLVP
jgi:SpoVK/Ycf46/Vps4 family AAA+-type ATPase